MRMILIAIALLASGCGVQLTTSGLGVPGTPTTPLAPVQHAKVAEPVEAPKAPEAAPEPELTAEKTQLNAELAQINAELATLCDAKILTGKSSADCDWVFAQDWYINKGYVGR